MSKQLKLFLSLCLVFSAGLETRAQKLPADKMQQVEAELPPDQTLVTKEILNNYIIDRTKLMVDIVWTTEHLLLAKPTVATTQINTRIPLYINGSTITYPTLYATLMDEIGITVGHDVYAQNKALPVGVPLLQQPYAMGHLFKSMDPAILYFENALYDQAKGHIVCPETVMGCRNVQSMVRYALNLFLVAHECGHYVHGDQQETLDRDREESADAFAWDVIRKIATAYHTDDQDVNDMIDQMFEAGAFAFLAFERQSNINRVRFNGGDPDQDPSIAILNDRMSALSDAAGDLGDTILDLMPEDDVSTDYQPVSLQWSTPPTVLIVNGTALTVGQSNGKTLLLPSGSRAKILAWSVDGVAYSELDAQQSNAISLHYLPYVASASRADIEAALSAKDWAAVLRMGTSDGGRKIGAWATHAVNVTLRHCNARVMIDPTPTGNATEDEKARIDANAAAALATWGVQ
jgi:hypothetical protein